MKFVNSHLRKSLTLNPSHRLFTTVTRSSFPLQDSAASGYFPSVTLLRGVAILMVFAYHIINQQWVAGVPVVLQLVKYGFSGVDVFFIISGFIIPYTMWRSKYTWRRFPRFIARRLARLHPPYLLSIALAILMEVIFFHINRWEYHVDWTRVWVHSLYLIEYTHYVSYNSVYWTLAVELQFYLLLAFIFPFIVSPKKWVRWLTLAALACLTFCIHYYDKEHLFRHTFMFINGILLFQFVAGVIEKRELLILILINWVLMYFSMAPYGIMVAVFTTFVLLFYRKKFVITEYLGKISYSFYLTHMIVSGWMMVFLKDRLEDGWLATGVRLVLSLVVASVFYYIIERPSVKLAGKIRMHRASEGEEVKDKQPA